ncbi:MAG: hypothetical protein Q9M14_02980 [Mariprofundaceae bacterium]|nr:hypothetical protein [Mariprofundaceae bacterium]
MKKTTLSMVIWFILVKKIQIKLYAIGSLEHIQSRNSSMVGGVSNRSISNILQDYIALKQNNVGGLWALI